MTRTPFSPFPPFSKGGDEALEELANLDKDIIHLKSIVADLKEERQKARNLKSQNPTETGWEPKSVLESHSDYLTITENQRRAENELHNLLIERLTLVFRAGVEYQEDMRGDFFPHPTLEEIAKEFIQRHKDRLMAVTTVAFFGSGITFSTIFSGTRGTIGLMSFSWAAFAVSFSVCVFLQYVNPESPPAIIANLRRRVFLTWTVMFAAFASFVGIVLMGTTVAMLNANSVKQIDTRVDTSWGGVLSLLPVILAFIWGQINIAIHGYQQMLILRRRRYNQE